jgi:hypothetical protein
MSSLIPIQLYRGIEAFLLKVLVCAPAGTQHRALSSCLCVSGNQKEPLLQQRLGKEVFV